MVQLFKQGEISTILYKALHSLYLESRNALVTVDVQNEGVTGIKPQTCDV